MDSRGASPRKKQKLVSKTSGICKKDDGNSKSSSIPKIILLDSDKAQTSGKTLKDTQKLHVVRDNVHIDESKEEHKNQSDQQGQQSLQNVVSTSAPKDKSEETLPENIYVHGRPSTSQGLKFNETHEIGKTKTACGSLESKQIDTKASSDSNNSESEEYSSDEGDEIEIISVTQIDEREPCQDHVTERILYCEWCAAIKHKGKENLIPEARCMCFDCELYLCLNCASTHSYHATVRVDEHESVNDHHINELVDSLLLEDDDERQNRMAESRYNICGKIYVRMFRESPSPGTCMIIDVCISKDGKLLIATDGYNHSIKVFNMYNHKMIQCIKMSSTPHGVTEIPHHLIQEHFPDDIDNLEINSCHTYIAVSFPKENRILIIDFTKNHSRIVYTLWIYGASECREVFLCNGNLVTYCTNDLNHPTDHEIKVLTMKGREVWTIDILDLPGPGFTSTYKAFHIAVHEASETIFICSPRCISIVAVNISGKVIECVSSKNIGIVPEKIHVDSDRNVFVSSYSSGFHEIRDHMKKWVIHRPNNPLIVSNNQSQCVHTSRKGKLFCVDSYTSSYFVTILQSEPCFFSYENTGVLYKFWKISNGQQLSAFPILSLRNKLSTNK